MTDPSWATRPEPCGSGSPRPRPATCTSATPARRCSTGPSRATTAARFVLPHRGHRPRPQHPGVLRRAHRRDALARPRLGRGPRGRRRARALPPVRAVRHLPRRRSRGSSESVADLRLLLHQRGGRGAPQGVGLQDPGVRRPLPRPHRRAASRPSRPRAATRSCGSGCPTARSPSTTSSAARSPSSTEHVPDFALVRANGDPLYTLVNPVDDALMGITHVLRGEDLLSSTPRQIALYEALERARHRHVGSRASATCPIVMGEGNKRLSKRDAEVRPDRLRRARASCPRGCSTTWRCSAGRSPRTATCSPWRRWSRPSTSRRVNPNPARFDLKKLEAINAAHMRLLSIEELERAAAPFLQRGRPDRGPADRRRRPLKLTEGDAC